MVQYQPIPGYFPPVRLREIFIDPDRGSDAAVGSQMQPYKTITHALRQGLVGAVVIHLNPGIYSAETGEVFPLLIPPQVSILGRSASQNIGQSIGQSTGHSNTVVIQGGGGYNSASFGSQNIAIFLGESTHLRGVTVTNATERGTGIWLESSNASVVNCQIVQCGREGIFVSETANPMILDSVLLDNRASGITFVRYARGEVRRCLHQGNGFGLVISDYAAPLIADNQFKENRSGIILSGNARPVLRRNRIEHNQKDGVAVYGKAVPDLGNSQDAADNSFSQNQECDLRNATPTVLTATENDLHPSRIIGSVLIGMSSIAGVAEQQKKAKEAATSRDHSFRSTTHPTKRLAPILTPSLPAPLSLSSHPFPDLVGHWATAFIESLTAQRQISNSSDGVFQPNQPVSRATYAVWATQIFDQDPSTDRPSRSFQDVPAQHWAAAAVAKADRIGFIAHIADDQFRPDAPLNRLHAILWLTQGLRFTDGNPGVLSQYRDRAQLPSFAIKAVAAATQKRLIVREPGNDRLNPFEPITRAELAVMLYQSLVALGQAPPIASPYIVNPTIHPASFVDIQGHWAADFIRSLASQGWIGGSPEGQFAPDRPMTRAEYAALLVQVFDPVPERAAKTFIDVPAQFWAGQAIEQVYQSKLMGGFADGTFRPNQPITRVQVLLALVNALKSPGADLDILQRYRDESEVPNSVRPAIATATAQWLVVNYPKLTYLRPNQAATRAEIAAMLHQALVRSGRAAAIPSPYIIHPHYPDQHRSFRTTTVVVLDPGHGGSDLGVAGAGNLKELMGGTSPAAMNPPNPPAGMPPNPPGFNGMPPYPGQGMMPPMPPGANRMPPMPPPGMPPMPPGANMPGMQPYPGMPPAPPSAPEMPGMPIVREKDVVLSIALDAAEYLRNQGIRVVLTRSADRDLDLPSRTQIAHQVNADLFVSIHANADAQGQLDVNGVEIYHYPQSQESANLAEALRQTIVQSVEISDRGVRPANFYVLRTLSIPAALIEVGYMTGQTDAANLADITYRQQMAEAIGNGILHYVKEVME